MIRRVLGRLAAAVVGVIFALAFVGSMDPELVRLAWAAGPNLLYSSARVDGTAFTAGTDGVVAVGGLDAAGALNVASPTDPFPVATPAGAEIDVDLIKIAGTATNVNGGNRSAGTQTVTLADNDPAVVDLAAIEVLQTTIAGDTTSLDGKVAVGGGAEAGAVLVTVANDSTGLVSVDDGAGSLTTDINGIVAAQDHGAAVPAGVLMIGGRDSAGAAKRAQAVFFGDNRPVPGTDTLHVGSTIFVYDGTNLDLLRSSGTNEYDILVAPNSGNTYEDSSGADAQLSASAAVVGAVSVYCSGGAACEVAIRSVWDGDCDAGNAAQVDYLYVGGAANSSGNWWSPIPVEAAAVCMDVLAGTPHVTVSYR